MMTQRKSYSRQFKIDAEKLVTDQGYKISEAARNLEINPNLLGKWKNQYAGESGQVLSRQRPNDTGSRGTPPTTKGKSTASHGA